MVQCQQWTGSKARLTTTKGEEMSNNHFAGVAMIVMVASFAGGVSVGRDSMKKADVVEMSENEFRRHQHRIAEQDMVKSLMLSEQRAQARRDHKNSISGQDKEDLIGIIKGAFND